MYDAEYSLRGICSCRACSRSSECRGEPIPVPPWRILSDYRSFSRLGARTTIPQPGASVYGSALHIPHAFAEDCAKERAFAPSPALQRRILSDYRSFSRLGARTTIPPPGASVYGSALHIPHAFAEDCAKERAFAPVPLCSGEICTIHRSFSRLGARSSTVRIYSRGVMPSLERNWRENAGRLEYPSS